MFDIFEFAIVDAFVGKHTYYVCISARKFSKGKRKPDAQAILNIKCVGTRTRNRPFQYLSMWIFLKPV